MISKEHMDLINELASPMADRISDTAREVYMTAYKRAGNSDYFGQSLLINSFAIAYARALAVFLHNYSKMELRDLYEDVYVELQKFASDILAKHSNGKTAFMVELPPKEGKK